MAYIVEREFEHAGYKCVVVFQKMGHRCGYVGVPKGSKLYGKRCSDKLDVDMSELEGQEIGKRGIIPIFLQAFDGGENVRLDLYFDVHGGITFADGGDGSDYPIKSDLWWLGFDCGHAGDRIDYELSMKIFPEKAEKYKRLMQIDREVYGEPEERDDVIRSEEYVAEECKRLAEQIREYEGR